MSVKTGLSDRAGSITANKNNVETRPESAFQVERVCDSSECVVIGMIVHHMRRMNRRMADNYASNNKVRGIIRDRVTTHQLIPDRLIHPREEITFIDREADIDECGNAGRPFLALTTCAPAMHQPEPYCAGYALNDLYGRECLIHQYA